MMESYIYDIEIYPNLFMLTLINAATNPKLIIAYQKHAIAENTEALDKLHDAMGVRTFIISDEYRNDMPLLLSFMRSHKNMIGYNSYNYDDLILDYICMYGARFNKDLRNAKGKRFNDIMYRLSSDIVNYSGSYKFQFKEDYDMKFYKKLYNGYDIQRILYLDKKFVGLKQVAIMLKWYLIQDLPYDPTETLNITDELVKALQFYNINDCLITKRVWDVSVEEILLRENISKLYHINVKNESRSGIADKYFAKVYSERAGISISALNKLRSYRTLIKISDLMSPKVKFTSDRFKDMLWQLNKTVLRVGSKDEDRQFKVDLAYMNKLYMVRKGGLHSKDAPGYYESNDEYVYVDADVTSFYPYIMILLGVCPAHLDKVIFREILLDIVNDRVGAKELTLKIQSAMKSDKQFTTDELAKLEHALEISNTRAEALKIVVNTIYGKTGSAYSPLYDPKAMYKTTINGQMFLLMLIEMLGTIGIQNVSANTDGIISKVKRTDLDKFYAVCKQWEELTGFALEYTFYEKYICSDVNNYIAIKDGFANSTEPNDVRERYYVKRKGAYLTEIVLDKGYFAPVISKCISDYYCYNIPIEESLMANKDIYDFCISKKTNNDFYSVFSTVDKDTNKFIEELLQKNNRFYISEVATGGITKKYKNPKRNKKGVVITEISMAAKHDVVIFNKFYNVDNFEEYKIKYRFYYTEIMKRIIPIEMSRNTLFS